MKTDLTDREHQVILRHVAGLNWMPCEYEIEDGSKTYKCSHCGEEQRLIDGTPKDNGWLYCPNCGAKMDS